MLPPEPVKAGLPCRLELEAVWIGGRAEVRRLQPWEAEVGGSQRIVGMGGGKRRAKEDDLFSVCDDEGEGEDEESCDEAEIVHGGGSFGGRFLSGGVMIGPLQCVTGRQNVTQR